MIARDDDAPGVAYYRKALRRTLPRRVRVRLWWDRRVDRVAIWLVDHRRFGAAQAVWRALGTRRVPQG